MLRSKDGELLGLVLAHVDDLLMTLKPCPETEAFKKELRKRIKFGAWDAAQSEKGFKYCGRTWKQNPDFSVDISMMDYVEQFTPAKISRERRAQPDSSLTESEHPSFRALVGQALWLARMIMPGLAEIASRLSGKLAKPTIEDLKDANSMVKLAHKLPSTRHHAGEVSLRTGVILGVADSAFDNLPNHRSQRGHHVYIGDPNIATDRTKLHAIALLESKSNRVKRMVRSTLATEAYSMSEASEACDHWRALLSEVFDKDFKLRDWELTAARRNVTLVTDAKSLYDAVALDTNPKISDRRLSLEVAIIRNLRDHNMSYAWIPSTQMIADNFTKSVDAPIVDYLNQVIDSGQWTLGPDHRAPVSKRVTQNTMKELTKQ